MGVKQSASYNFYIQGPKGIRISSLIEMMQEGTYGELMKDESGHQL
jgi:hypothetical protein